MSSSENTTPYQLELAKSCLSLEKLMQINLKAREKALMFPLMMHHNVSAIKNCHCMHLSQLYKFKFTHVASAFIKKYQDENT